jgi:protein gp37
MGDTAIEWTHRPGTRGRTWNPVRGCSRTIAAGAKQSGCGDGTGGGCYAERTAGRFCGPGQPYEGLVRITAKGARWTGEVRLVVDHVRDPLRWREPSTVFTNSMSDLFHESLDDSSIDYVVAVMMICALRSNGPRHVFQTLTKRSARLRAYFSDPTTQERVARRAGAMMEDGDAWFDLIAFRDEGLVHPSMWWGVSTENQEAFDERWPDLEATPAAMRFLSCEPLIGGINAMPATQSGKLGWLIVGCESGPRSRPTDTRWLRWLREQCQDSNVPFFLKQAVDVGDERFGVNSEGMPQGITCGTGSKRKAGGVVGSPYLDGTQHIAFPEAP